MIETRRFYCLIVGLIYQKIMGALKKNGWPYANVLPRSLASRYLMKLASATGDEGRAYVASLPDLDVIDSGELLEVVEPKSLPNKKTKLLHFDYLLDEEVIDWLIDKLVQKNSLSFLFGASGDGKTFVAIHMAACLLLGKDFAGHHIEKPYNVIYIAAEDPTGVRLRMRETLQSMGHLGQIAFPHVRQPVDFCSDAETDLFLKVIVADCKEHNFNPDVVFVDTQARCYGGAENSADDGGRYIANQQRVMRALGVGIINIHHTGKDKTKGMRGSSAINAAADTCMFVEKDKTSTAVQLVTTISNAKQRYVSISNPPLRMTFIPSGETLVYSDRDVVDVALLEGPKADITGVMMCGVYKVLCNMVPLDGSFTSKQVNRWLRDFNGYKSKDYWVRTRDNLIEVGALEEIEDDIWKVINKDLTTSE